MKPLRWLLVLPGAFVAALIVMFPWHWLVLIGSVFDFFYIDAIGMENVERLGYGFLTPFTMIVASSFIAPSQKMNTGKVVAVLIFLFIVYSNMIGVSDTQPSFWEAIRIHEGLGKLYPIVLLALQSCGIYMGLTKNQEIQNYIKMRYNRE